MLISLYFLTSLEKKIWEPLNKEKKAFLIQETQNKIPVIYRCVLQVPLNKKIKKINTNSLRYQFALITTYTIQPAKYLISSIESIFRFFLTLIFSGISKAFFVLGLNRQRSAKEVKISNCFHKTSSVSRRNFLDLVYSIKMLVFNILRMPVVFYDLLHKEKINEFYEKFSRELKEMEVEKMLSREVDHSKLASLYMGFSLIKA